MRRRFFRRMVPFFLFVAAWFFGAIALVSWIVARAFGFPEGQSVLLVVLVLVILGFAATGRARRFAAPVGELIDALGRVASGEQGVRVRGRGPREVRAVGDAFNTMAERIERVEAERRRLLADVTHELRTPLTVMRAQLEGLLDGVYPSDAAHLAPLVEQTRLLERLIDDLRTLSLAEAGALELHREPTDVRVLAQSAVAAFRAQAEAGAVELVSEVAPDLPAIDVDPLRMREVLGNLLVNALRHTPRGGQVVLSAERDGPGGAVRIAVRDTGAGITADALPRVFDRFYRSADSNGSGLGLAIARSLVASHGGEIAAQSEGAGRGTTVRFTVPVAP